MLWHDSVHVVPQNGPRAYQAQPEPIAGSLEHLAVGCCCLRVGCRVGWSFGAGGCVLLRVGVRLCVCFVCVFVRGCCGCVLVSLLCWSLIVRHAQLYNGRLARRPAQGNGDRLQFTRERESGVP